MGKTTRFWELRHRPQFGEDVTGGASHVVFVEIGFVDQTGTDICFALAEARFPPGIEWTAGDRYGVNEMQRLNDRLHGLLHGSFQKANSRQNRHRNRSRLVCENSRNRQAPSAPLQHCGLSHQFGRGAGFLDPRRAVGSQKAHDFRAAFSDQNRCATRSVLHLGMIARQANRGKTHV